MKRNETGPCPPRERGQGMDVGKAVLGERAQLHWSTEQLTGASGDTEGSQRQGCLHRDLQELVGQEMAFQAEGIMWQREGGMKTHTRPV